MKMKVLLSVIVFTLYTVSYAQNMKAGGCDLLPLRHGAAPF